MTRGERAGIGAVILAAGVLAVAAWIRMSGTGQFHGAYPHDAILVMNAPRYSFPGN